MYSNNFPMKTYFIILQLYFTMLSFIICLYTSIHLLHRSSYSTNIYIKHLQLHCSVGMFIVFVNAKLGWGLKMFGI